jgi:outer membrane murein-binding lipoprotein Lpp
VAGYDWLIIAAITLLCVAYLLKDETMEQLKAQVAASLSTMASAVDMLKQQVEALGAAKSSVSAEELAATVARLKQGTDTLAAAVESAKQALVA